MKLLLDQGASVHPVVSRLLERAAEYGEADVVRVFLERGIHQVPGCLDKGESALYCAKSAGNERVVRVLGEFLGSLKIQVRIDRMYPFQRVSFLSFCDKSSSLSMRALFPIIN